MRIYFVVLIAVFSTTANSAGFSIKGISTSQNTEVLKRSSMVLRSPGKENKVFQYCQETDNERKEFFTFKAKFFKGFESILYKTKRDKYGYLIGHKTIGGFKLDSVKYDIYKKKIARLDITVDTYDAGRAKAVRVFSKLFQKKYGKQKGYHSWKKEGEELRFEVDPIGNTHIYIVNKKRMAAIDSLTKNACYKHKDDDIKSNINDI